MSHSHLIVHCDHPCCTETIAVERRDGYWNGQQKQEAENLGWTLDWNEKDFCPEHDPMWP